MAARHRFFFLPAVVTLCFFCGVGLGATSAENNPFVATGLQVDARMARIQQEVDRLFAAGMFTASNDMQRRLSHFRAEMGGIEPSQVSGPELDAIGMYTGDTGNPVVEIH